MRNQTLFNFLASIGAAALAACSSPGTGGSASTETLGTTQEAIDAVGICNMDPRVNLGLVPLSVCAGARLFFDETFAGT